MSVSKLNKVTFPSPGRWQGEVEVPSISVGFFVRGSSFFYPKKIIYRPLIISIRQRKYLHWGKCNFFGQGMWVCEAYNAICWKKRMVTDPGCAGFENWIKGLV